MAAQALVRPSYENPVDTYATNVMGTVNILESARQCASVKTVLIITSDKCYENREWYWGYREIDPMGGHDPICMQQGVRGTGYGFLQKIVFPCFTISTARGRFSQCPRWEMSSVGVTGPRID